MKKSYLRLAAAMLTIFMAFAAAGCMRANASDEDARSGDAASAESTAPAPEMPEGISLDGEGVPQLTVYAVDTGVYRNMDIEGYVKGVLAGEMRNDWPMEALKAQAILARTYAVKFLSEKKSAYDGADISTDIREAQAYDESKINDRIEKAVDETKGQVLSYNAELPYAWFHAHSGGMTEYAVPGLEYENAEPEYTQSVESLDSDKAPNTSKEWTAEFTASEVGKAASDAGVRTGKVNTIAIGETTNSGRATTLVINGRSVSAPKIRLALDSKKLKSTMLTDVSITGDTVTFSGRGYGHGVGMSQWGAYAMAESGKKADEIVKYYFKGVDVVNMWR